MKVFHFWIAAFCLTLSYQSLKAERQYRLGSVFDTHNGQTVPDSGTAAPRSQATPMQLRRPLVNEQQPQRRLDPLSPRTTDPGNARFTPVTEGELSRRGVDPQKFGEAWRDPSGRTWGNIKIKQDGSPDYMDHKAATKHCTDIGAKLPSRADFVGLRNDMGAQQQSESERGYIPQNVVLPSLTYISNGAYNTNGRIIGYKYWASSVDPDNADYFDGRTGKIKNIKRENVYFFVVRCVLAPQ